MNISFVGSFHIPCAASCEFVQPLCDSQREAKLLALVSFRLQYRDFVRVCTLAELRVCSPGMMPNCWHHSFPVSLYYSPSTSSPESQ